MRNPWSHVDHWGLERSLLELIKIRASQINGCAYCLSMYAYQGRTRRRSVPRARTSRSARFSAISVRTIEVVLHETIRVRRRPTAVVQLASATKEWSVTACSSPPSRMNFMPARRYFSAFMAPNFRGVQSMTASTCISK